MTENDLNKRCSECGGLKDFSARKTFPALAERFDFLHRIWQIACITAGSIKALEGKNEKEDLFKGTVIYLTWKGLKTQLAIEKLLESGFLEDAYSLIRSLMEIVINLQYIRKDPEFLALTYQEYSYIIRHRLLEAGRRIYKNFPDPETESAVADLEVNYQRVKGSYPNEYRWSGCSIRKMADQACLADLYDTIYSNLSVYIHSSALSQNSFIRSDANGFKIIIAPDQHDEVQFENAIYLACTFSLMLVNIYHEVFNTAFANEIEAISLESQKRYAKK